jgi:fructosamine-3-kinase
MQKLQQEVSDHLQAETGLKVVKFTQIRGGCISRAYKLDMNDKSTLFVKVRPR